jgi:hypothetical protein
VSTHVCFFFSILVPAHKSGAVNGKTKYHGDVLKRHHGLVAWKVECVGLQMPPVDKCHPRGVCHRQSAGDESSKSQEPCMPYEQHVPLVPRQGQCVRILSGCNT